MEKYSGDYDRKEFYSLMGKFFAEPEYRKLMPYLANRDIDEWLLIKKDGEVVAFSSYAVTKSEINIKSCYYHNLLDARKMIKRIIKEIPEKECLTIILKENQKLIQMLMKEFRFMQTKETKNYIYLRREKMK